MKNDNMNTVLRPESSQASVNQAFIGSNMSQTSIPEQSGFHQHKNNTSFFGKEIHLNSQKRRADFFQNVSQILKSSRRDDTN